MSLPDKLYVVQAWHYAQYEVEEEHEDGRVDVEILDEDDCGIALVAVRTSAEEAERAAVEYEEACYVVADSIEEMQRPIAAINIFEVTAGTPVPGRFVKTVVDYSGGSAR